MWLIILCSGFAMAHPPGFDSLSFDPCSLHQDGLAAPEEDISRCEVIQALVVSMVIVVIDKGRDLGLEVFREEVA